MSENGAPAPTVTTPTADQSRTGQGGGNGQSGPGGQEVVTALVRPDGTGEVVLDGVTTRVTTAGVAEAGAAIMELVAELARQRGRSVPAQVQDPDGLWSLLVHADGSVEEAGAALADTRGRRGQGDEVAASSTTVTSAVATGALPTLDDLLSTRRTVASGAAEQGWRKGVRRATFGLVAPAPGAAEQRYRGQVDRVQRVLDGPRTIVVINPKGGAHKTTATLLLAATFGIHRGGYTLAWDNNETRGTLGWRAQHGEHARTAVDLVQDLRNFSDLRSARIGDLDSYVRSQGSSQFDVLASDEDAASAASIDASAFSALHSTLSRFYRVVVVDTGNNMRASNWQEAVTTADQLVFVSTIREDTAQSAAWAIDALRSMGHEDKVRSAVTILSAPEPKVDRHLRTRLHGHFGALTRAVLDVPHDRRLIPGGPIDYASLAPATRDAWLEVTATVADGL